ncbi:hypothetical protein [Streptomyces sp. NPDC005485]|uniref:hypothetical protein n=1 Tax=Streptomyces sp. NPDC005485 TaxID=3155591 RepID=UPI0033BE8D8F
MRSSEQSAVLDDGLRDGTREKHGRRERLRNLISGLRVAWPGTSLTGRARMTSSSARSQRRLRMAPQWARRRAVRENSTAWAASPTRRQRPWHRSVAMRSWLPGVDAEHIGDDQRR